MKTEQDDREGHGKRGREGEFRQEEIWGHLGMKKDDKDKGGKRRDVRKIDGLTRRTD